MYDHSDPALRDHSPEIASTTSNSKEGEHAVYMDASVQSKRRATERDLSAMTVPTFVGKDALS